MHLALEIAAAVAVLALAFELGRRWARAELLTDNARIVDRLARERREPPTSKSNLCLMRGGRA